MSTKFLLMSLLQILFVCKKSQMDVIHNPHNTGRERLIRTRLIRSST